MFKINKTEVENQRNRKIKAVGSDRSDEYYGRYDLSGRCPGFFLSIFCKSVVL